MLAQRLSTLTHYEDHITLIPLANIFFPNMDRQRLVPTIHLVCFNRERVLNKNNKISNFTEPLNDFFFDYEIL